MKTKMLLLALVILGTNLVYSQNPDQTSKTECKKKVLKTIKRQMNLVNFRDYIPVGSETNVIITCFANDKNIIEVANIKGVYENLNGVIAERFENHPVKCEDQPIGSEFSLMLTFKHIPIEI